MSRKGKLKKEKDKLNSFNKKGNRYWSKEKWRWQLIWGKRKIMEIIKF